MLFLKNGFCSYFVIPWFGLIYLISERHCCCWFFERIFGLKKWAIVFIKFSYKHILIISFINDYFSIYFTHLIYNDREILKDRGRMGHWQQQQEGMQAKDIISIIWEICNFGWTIWVGNFICNQKQMNIWEREKDGERNSVWRLRVFLYWVAERKRLTFRIICILIRCSLIVFNENEMKMKKLNLKKNEFLEKSLVWSICHHGGQRNSVTKR